MRKEPSIIYDLQARGEWSFAEVVTVKNATVLCTASAFMLASYVQAIRNSGGERSNNCLAPAKVKATRRTWPLSAWGGDMQELAQQTNTFCQSVTMDFTPIAAGDSFHIGPDCTVLDRFIISVPDTVRMLLSPNTSKACGPDGISTWILKEYACLLCGPLCCIFNSSLRDGYISEIIMEGRGQVPRTRGPFTVTHWDGSTTNITDCYPV